MARLSVNVDHVATLRQARLDVEPDPVAAALVAELAGADGITVHLREDRRHIQDRDLRILRDTVKTSLNLEMAATDEMLSVALETRPDMVTLVPEKRAELTTEGGLNLAANSDTLARVVSALGDAGIGVNLFVDPDPRSIKETKRIGPRGVELHTGAYANARGPARETELKRIGDAASLASRLGLRVHAGHGLDYRNVMAVREIEEIEEFAIGFSIVARSVFVGIERAVREMKALVA